MERIGIRELRQHASRWVRRAAAGESFEVTDRGRPVARLQPIPPGEGVERLVAEGRISEAEGDLLALGLPLPPKPGVKLPSEVLAELRADER
ncbi:MAG: type II toxin-antitoxin system prevent-host-death family antitoxin [Gaiellaceae bacterium MAG52_C11]|nr:type II toxin-antitoxin system prevent-host-death family antitoxin [Candidatus Gaiellasilicea maunaloa]